MVSAYLGELTFLSLQQYPISKEDRYSSLSVETPHIQSGDSAQVRRLRTNSGGASGAADQPRTTFQKILVRRLRPLGAETPATAETPGSLRTHSARISGCADMLGFQKQEAGGGDSGPGDRRLRGCGDSGPIPDQLRTCFWQCRCNIP